MANEVMTDGLALKIGQLRLQKMKTRKLFQSGGNEIIKSGVELKFKKANKINDAIKI